MDLAVNVSDTIKVADFVGQVFVALVEKIVAFIELVVTKGHRFIVRLFGVSPPKTSQYNKKGHSF